MLIDKADYDLICAPGYRWRVTTAGKFRYPYASSKTAAHGFTLMHRLILNAPEGTAVDHIDGNGLNNTRANLRLCSYAENSRNSRGAAGRDLPKGVWRNGRRFSAQITNDYTRIYLGIFDTPELAHAAYCAAAQRLHGEFWNPGVPREART